jgi:hypothetical protein
LLNLLADSAEIGFVGTARVLKTMLSRSGFRPQRCYISSDFRAGTLRCLPAQNVLALPESLLVLPVQLLFEPPFLLGQDRRREVLHAQVQLSLAD